MAVTVRIPTTLRPLSGGASTVQVEGARLTDVIANLDATHPGFSDRLLFNANQNGDDAVGCGLFVGPGDPRPVTFEANLPPDFLGGPALGVDPSGSMCEPICPLPPPSFMLHARQNMIAKAASIAFFEHKLRGSVSGHRMITGRVASDNADVTLQYAE